MLKDCIAPQQAGMKDRRFRNLLGEAAWASLPASVRRRFGKRLKGGASVVYQGRVTAMHMNLAGCLLAQLARLIGAPLPYDRTCLHQPAVVSVTEDIAGDGQFWLRQYGRAAGFPQVIHSSKRFNGPTGIEEYIGSGVGIALKVSARPDGLSFESDHYFLQVASWRLRLPAWLSPGALTIVHRDLGKAGFLFSLSLKSRFFGELVHQDAVFHDSEDQSDG
ncbi:DUF4166 domain-containing protein [Roseibium sediminicola]|uniref:DUF4166 domain-containing protein n=1 Tax=Roseibium sediminicola TaxID=2933272 RepID=A0ABT0GX55_9HYPH|nr:DUF4166 domain-containing protein [Roseibium sp. CAU 1639]MCK7614031.1 DUF4166 domain-containing protein [Roseibium sp. CAU 1639]